MAHLSNVPLAPVEQFRTRRAAVPAKMALSGALQTCDRFQLAPRATRRLNGHPTVAWNPLTATRKASTARRALTAVPRHVHADSRASAVGRRGARSYRTHKAAPARKSRRAAFRRVFARASRTGRRGLAPGTCWRRRRRRSRHVHALLLDPQCPRRRRRRRRRRAILLVRKKGWH